MPAPKPRSLPPPPPQHRSGIRPAPASALPPPPPVPRENVERQMRDLQEDLDLIIDASSARLDEMERRQGELEEQLVRRLDRLENWDVKAKLLAFERRAERSEARADELEETLRRTRGSLRDLTRKMQEIYTETKAYAAAVGQFGAVQAATSARLSAVERALASPAAAGGDRALLEALGAQIEALRRQVDRGREPTRPT